MIDWDLVAKIAGGAYGINILVLVILAIAAWLVGLAVQKVTARNKKDEKKG